MANNSNSNNNSNNELDANIVIDGQKVIATLAQTGEVIKDGGEIDATSVIQTETGKQKVVKVVNLGGGGGDLDKNKVIVKSATLPTASAENVGQIHIYSGETNSNYTHGFIYENKNTGTYSASVNFQPASISGITITCANDNFLSFIKQFVPSANLTDFAKGTMTYDGTSGLWVFKAQKADDSVLATYQVYQVDYEEAGFTFSGEPTDTDIVSFTCSISGTASYEWVRIDVQPTAGIILQANTNRSVNGYQVPVLSDTQITQAYNGLVAGKQVVITDATGLMHFAVNQADIVSDEPIISIEYFDIMELTYLTDGTIEYRSHNNQITLTQEQFDALTTYADHTDYRIIE